LTIEVLPHIGEISHQEHDEDGNSDEVANQEGRKSTDSQGSDILNKVGKMTNTSDGRL
jgi:hypothetical protein